MKHKLSNIVLICLLPLLAFGTAYTVIKIDGTIYSNDSLLVGNGTTYDVKAVADCDDTGGNHLNYDTSTNAFSCGTSSGASGVAQTTGTFEATWDNACTTTPSQTWNYTKTGNVVTIRMMDEVSCTSDSTTFDTSAGVVPADIRPVTAVVSLLGVAYADAGAAGATFGCLQITSGGRMFLARSATTQCDNAAWTNSGLKELYLSTAPGNANFTYTLD